MSLELVNESIKVSSVIGEDNSQVVFENDIIVPDYKPDIARVLMIDGDVAVNNADLTNDKVTINGTEYYKILYVTDEETPQIKSINTSSNFSYGLDIQGARSGMNINPNCNVEHMEYTILNSRKINVKTVLNLSARVTDISTQNIISGLEGDKDLQVLRESITVNSFVGERISEFDVIENLEVPVGKPSIKEILRNDIKISGKDFRITEDKIMAKADLNITTLYIADDETNSIQVMEHEVPFTHMFDFEELSEDDKCSVDFRISGFEFDIEGDSDGEPRVLSSKVGISITSQAFKRKDLDTVADAYSPALRVSFDKKPFEIEEIIESVKDQAVLKDSVTLGSTDPEIAEVFNVISKPSVSDVIVNDGKLTVEGVVNNSVLYLSNDSLNPVVCKQQEVPFSQSIDVDSLSEGMRCDVELDIGHNNYSMVSPYEVEVRLVVDINAKVRGNQAIPLIENVNDIPVENTRSAELPSITIYFTQPGDTLWSIAKKYCTTISDIENVNNIYDRDVLNPGEQIIVPKTLS